jgi:hypothetical protein
MSGTPYSLCGSAKIDLCLSKCNSTDARRQFF